MTAQELKRSILQLAMQGGLVAPILGEDAHNDYPELFDVKSKRDYSSDDEEIPYDIPDRWIWARLKDIATNQNGYAFKPSDWKQSGLRIIRIQNLTDNAATCNYCDSKEEYDRFSISDGDVLVSWSCTIDAFIYHGEKAILNQHIFRVDFDKVEIDKTFYVYAIKSLLFYINSKRHGATMTHITKKDFEALLFPIPPLAEQRRIVAKIEELKPLVEEYGNVEERLTTLNAGFPDKLRKSILQQAIQGKLTEQDPADEPVSELLKRIHAEKERLIKEGKIKKGKSLLLVAEDEIPFEIPNSWAWVRLATVTDMLSGFAFKSDDYKNEGKYRLLRGINLGVDEIRWEETVFVDAILDKHEAYKLASGDVLLGLDRPWISNGTRVAIFDDVEETFLVQRVLRIRGIGGIISPYISLLLHSSLLKNPLDGETTGISVPHISQNQVGNIIVPLPPIAEQQRIVDRVNELLAMCDELK